MTDKGHCNVPAYKCSDHPSCVQRTYNQNQNQNNGIYAHPPLPNSRKKCEEWTERYPTMPGTFRIEKIKFSNYVTILDCNYRKNTFYSFILL